MAGKTTTQGLTVPARIGLLFKPPKGTPPWVRSVCRRFVAGWAVFCVSWIVLTLGSAWIPQSRALVTLPIALLGAVVAVLAYRAHARLVPVAPATDDAKCAQCGYDTSGLAAAGTCPECGRAYERLALEPPG